MSSDIHREALALLAEVWELSPDIRLGQLLAHLGFLGEAHLGRCLGDLEDDEIMAILQRHKAELQGRMPDTSASGKPQSGAAMSISGSSLLVESPPVGERR